MRRLFAALTALGLAAVPMIAHAASSPPKAIHDAVAAELEAAVNGDVTDPEDRAPARYTTPPPAMFSRLDVNVDGVDDWKVDFEGAYSASMFCGTGGCAIEVWVSRPGGGWEKAVDTQMREFKLTPAKAGARLDVDFHGTACGGAGAQACPRSYRWDEAQRRFVEIPNLKGETYLSGGPVQLAPIEAAAIPAAVAAAQRALVAACVARGTSLADPEDQIRSLPDLDGDGRRDWLVGGAYSSCNNPDSEAYSADLPITVLVTAGGTDGAREAWSGVDLFLAVDIGSSPATLRVIGRESPCEYGQVCGKPLRWDAAAGRLVE